MDENDFFENEEIFSKSLRAGRRTYFFDVRPTKAGDYYLTITESKKYSQDTGYSEYKKHKIYLYKEDFEGFKEMLNLSTDFILNEKGEEVISERHMKDFKREYSDQEPILKEATQYSHEDSSEDIKINDASLTSRFTDIEFDDI